MMTKEQLADMRKMVYDLNEKNTSALVIGRVNENGDVSFMMAGSLMEHCFTHKALGSTIDRIMNNNTKDNGPK